MLKMSKNRVKLVKKRGFALTSSKEHAGSSITANGKNRLFIEKWSKTFPTHFLRLHLDNSVSMIMSKDLSKVCPYFQSGRCNHGNSCKWFHPMPQKDPSLCPHFPLVSLFAFSSSLSTVSSLNDSTCPYLIKILIFLG